MTAHPSEPGREIFQNGIRIAHQTSEVLQPRKKAFDLPSSPIAPAWSFILALLSLAATSVRRDHLDIPIVLQSLSKCIAAVEALSPINRAGILLRNPVVLGLFNKNHFM